MHNLYQKSYGKRLMMGTRLKTLYPTLAAVRLPGTVTHSSSTFAHHPQALCHTRSLQGSQNTYTVQLSLGNAAAGA
jgi:hypothetical protein